MTLTTEQLRARAESLGLDFFIERRAGIWVKEWLNDGCSSATAEEVMMWSMLANREAQPVGKAEITKIAAELARGDYLSKLWTEAEKSRHVDTHRLQNLLDELHDVMKVKAIAITRLLTAPPAPAVPDGYCVMPLTLTAANGAKGALSGEFKVSRTVRCHECGGEGCDDCGDAGEFEEETTVPWDTIKEIYRAAVLNHVGDTNEKAVEKCECSSFDYCDNCLRAMLDQPVNSGYKLVPVDFLTTASRLIDLCRTYSILSDGGNYKERTISECESTMEVIDGLLAAAPEGGNG